MDNEIPKNVLKAMDNVYNLSKRVSKNVEIIENWAKDSGYLQSGDDRDIYIDGKYITDIAEIELGIMDGERFLKALNNK